MAGNTTHHAACSWIYHFFANGMSKLSLGFMTAGTNPITIALQHDKQVRAMHVMTFRAGFSSGMFIQCVFITNPCVLMAAHTYLSLTSL